MTGRLVASSLVLGALSLVVACGGGGDDAPSSATPTQVKTAAPVTESPSPATETEDGAGGDKLCAALSSATITGVTGWRDSLRQPHQGPGFLHFCTIYLDVPGCEMQCALSLEELGTIDASSNNSAEAFRAPLAGANPEAQFQFEDGVLDDKSWLATATAGALPDWKVLYFTRDGQVAYDLSSPRAAVGNLTRDQMIALARSLTVLAQ